MIIKRVIIESPYAGDVERNLIYRRAAMRDCLSKNEAPFASHGLYTQPGVLDDDNPEERKQGIAAGLVWGEVAHLVVVYVDLGVSDGMKFGIRQAVQRGRPVHFRSLPGFANDNAMAEVRRFKELICKEFGISTPSFH